MRLWRPVALILALALVAVPASAQVAEYLEEPFEDTPNIFNSGAWGMNKLDDGFQGDGLKSIIPAGQHWGSSGHWNFTSHGFAEPEELYWRYFLKFPEGFYIAPPNRGKLPGPAGLYHYRCLGNKASTTTEPCFSARMLFSRTYPHAGEPGYPNGPSDKTRIGFYTYNLDSPSNRGDIWPWDIEVGTLDHGKWYCVEGRIKLNTPGAHDGVLEGWVDGQEAFSKDDIAFRRSSESWLKIKSFWFDVYYGGDPSAVRNEIHFDSLALGTERVGCDVTYNGSFYDDDRSVFEPDIEWLAAKGITKGCNPPDNTRYCPDDPVTREVMAVYLSRALELPPTSEDFFDDDDGSQFEADINRMAAAGITKGCGERLYCPKRVVDRGQMAAFLTRALGLLDAGSGDLFTDDDDSIFETDINRLAVAGVTKGCNPPANDRYCPTSAVTRGAMAAFLHRAIGDSA